MAMKKKGYRGGGKVGMKKKGYRGGGKVMGMKSKGMKNGGKVTAKKMTVAQLRVAAKKMGYKVTKA